MNLILIAYLVFYVAPPPEPNMIRVTINDDLIAKSFQDPLDACVDWYHRQWNHRIVKVSMDAKTGELFTKEVVCQKFHEPKEKP